MYRLAAALLVLCTVVPATAVAGRPPVPTTTVIQVPQDNATIQGAIGAAADGDTVLVSPGTYNERIDFEHKNITVESAAGPATTIIDGGGVGVVVTLAADPGETPTIRGFTIQHGGGESTDGGVDTNGGPALIQGNWIVNNHFCDGGAVEAAFSAATIRGNVISGNSQSGCSGGSGGGGISIRGAGTVNVLGNLITGNSHGSAGGGLSLFAAGTPTISGNVISNNSSGDEGGGFWIVNHSDALITNNLIVGNHASADGGGIYWLVPSGSRGPFVVNNTIAGNTASGGTALYADGFDIAAELQNNILSGSGSAAVLQCGNSNDQNPPVIAYNDVFNAGPGPAYGGLCSDQTGQNGNIGADPLFVDPVNDFRVRPTSPTLEAGLNAVAPPDDIDGDARPYDFDHDGNALVDLGADEHMPMAFSHPLSPSVLPGGPWSLGIGSAPDGIRTRATALKGP